LFFSRLNPADWTAAAPPILWQGHGKGALDTYKLPNGDMMTLNLNIVTILPSQLYVFRSIHVQMSNGVGLPQLSIGQDEKPFAPGKPIVAILKGRSQGQSSGLHFDVGFELAVPWDGTSADCGGTWWAVWN